MRAFTINPDICRSGLSLNAVAMLDAIWQARGQHYMVQDRRPGRLLVDTRAKGMLRVSAFIETGANVVDFASKGLNFADALTALDELDCVVNMRPESYRPTWTERGRSLWRSVMHGNMLAVHHARADLGRAFACAQALNVLQQRNLLTSVQLDVVEQTLAIAWDGFKAPAFHRCQYPTASKQAHAWEAGRILATHGLSMSERSPVRWVRLGTVAIDGLMVSVLAQSVTGGHHG